MKKEKKKPLAICSHPNLIEPHVQLDTSCVLCLVWHVLSAERTVTWNLQESLHSTHIPTQAHSMPMCSLLQPTLTIIQVSSVRDNATSSCHVYRIQGLCDTLYHKTAAQCHGMSHRTPTHITCYKLRILQCVQVKVCLRYDTPTFHFLETDDTPNITLMCTGTVWETPCIPVLWGEKCEAH